MKTVLAFASGVAGVHYTPRPAGLRSLCGDLHSGGGAWSDFHVLSSWWESGEGTPSAEFFIARERDLNSRSKQTNKQNVRRKGVWLLRIRETPVVLEPSESNPVTRLRYYCHSGPLVKARGF